MLSSALLRVAPMQPPVRRFYLCFWLRTAGSPGLIHGSVKALTVPMFEATTRSIIPVGCEGVGRIRAQSLTGPWITPEFTGARFARVPLGRGR